jgi:hypothetical protein
MRQDVLFISCPLSQGTEGNHERNAWTSEHKIGVLTLELRRQMEIYSFIKYSISEDSQLRDVGFHIPWFFVTKAESRGSIVRYFFSYVNKEWTKHDDQCNQCLCPLKAYHKVVYISRYLIEFIPNVTMLDLDSIRMTGMQSSMHLLIHVSHECKCYRRDHGVTPLRCMSDGSCYCALIWGYNTLHISSVKRQKLFTDC